MKKTVLILSFLIDLTVYAAPRIETGPIVLPDENFSSISVQDELITKKLEVTDRAIICQKVYLCDVTIGDNLLIQGNLSVQGTSTLSGSALLTDLTVTGNTDLNELTVIGNTDLNNLTVTGNSNLTDLTVTGNSDLTDLTVTGNTDLTDLTVTGNTNLNNLTVAGNTNLNNLTASGNTDLTDLTVTGDTVLNTGSVTGNFTIDGTLFANVGDFTSLSTTNDADIGCNLTVGCNIYTQNSNGTIGTYYKNGVPWLHDFDGNNIYLGFGAGNFTLTGAFNVGIGDNALSNITSGTFNTALGQGAAFNLNSGSSNIVIGADTGLTLMSGSSNIYIGSDAAASAESNTIRIGTGQTRNFQVGIRNVTAVNTDTALVSVDSANQLGTGEIYNDANFASTTATQGAILKNGILWLHDSGLASIYLGLSAGNRTTIAADNIGIGSNALGSVMNGGANIGIGSNALLSVTSGLANIAFGVSALAAITNGTSNIALGSGALLQLQTIGNQSQNTAIGPNALNGLQAGTGNIAVGYRAGEDLLNGSNDIYIGNPGVDLDNGVVRIGTAGTHNVTYLQGNLFLQNLSATTPFVFDPLYYDDFTGQVLRFVSSQKFKKNIEPISHEAAQKFMQLQPVSYNAIEDASENPRIIYGFIAEDVNEIMPELVINDADGKPSTIGYVVMHALLLKLIQDQEEKINALQAKLIKIERADHSSPLKNQESIIAPLQEKVAAQDDLIESLIARIIVLENTH